MGRSPYRGLSLEGSSNLLHNTIYGVAFIDVLCSKLSLMDDQSQIRK